MRRMRSGCCARALRGQESEGAAAAPPRSVMNWRRLTRSPHRRGEQRKALEAERLAAFRLMISSYLVGACTGRSAGFSPLRMRSTHPAARRTLDRIRSVGDQATSGDEVAPGVDRGRRCRAASMMIRRDNASTTGSASRSGRHCRSARMSDGALISPHRARRPGSTPPPTTALLPDGAELPDPGGDGRFRRTAARVTPGAICLSSSSHFPLRPYSKVACPVAPGSRRSRRRLVDDNHEHDRHSAARL
jgi:hypothetical protein